MDFMQHAIEVSKRSELTPGRGHPKVGVVIVRDGEILVEACKKGSSHAEYQGVKTARERDIDLTGATAYVTLEPCTHRNHEDKYPCAEHLVRAGIKRVVIAMLDNNPEIRGRAVEAFLQHDVWVELAPVRYRRQVEELNAEFLNKLRAPEDTTADNRFG